MRVLLLAITAALLSGCAAVQEAPEARAAEAEAVLLGEQHDAAAHQRLQREWIEQLSQQRKLAAVALEMAEQGTSTAGLAPGSNEETVRTALRWNGDAWPWEAYGPAVMAAVRAGIPVVGANLPQKDMRAAMADSELDRLLPGPAIKAQQQAIRAGHCELLPEHQVTPMTRVQIARDRAMARTLAEAAVPGKTVVLLAGVGHVDPELGVPQHLPAKLVAKPVVLPPQPPAKDYCEEMRRLRKK